MNESIFRKKSIDKVSSPEQLNEYIRVASPAVWLILSAVIVFLVGIIVWGVFATADTKLPSVIISESGHTVCYVSADSGSALASGLKLTANGIDGTIKSVSQRPVLLGDDADAYLLYVGGFSRGDFCYTAEVEISGLPDGVYPANITVDSVSPISFVLR